MSRWVAPSRAQCTKRGQFLEIGTVEESKAETDAAR